MKFYYKENEPNYETFWMSDSDAINSMDPFNAILWFCSRKDRCLTYPSDKSNFSLNLARLCFRLINLNLNLIVGLGKYTARTYSYLMLKLQVLKNPKKIFEKPIF